jgi:hypothetical protein
MGYKLGPTRSKRLCADEGVADRKKDIYDEDIEALVDEDRRFA